MSATKSPLQVPWRVSTLGADNDGSIGIMADLDDDNSVCVARVQSTRSDVKKRDAWKTGDIVRDIIAEAIVRDHNATFRRTEPMKHVKAPVAPEDPVMARALEIFADANERRARAVALVAINPQCGLFGGEVTLPAISTFAEALELAEFEASAPNANDRIALLMADYRARAWRV